MRAAPQSVQFHNTTLPSQGSAKMVALSKLIANVGNSSARKAAKRESPRRITKLTKPIEAKQPASYEDDSQSPAAKQKYSNNDFSLLSQDRKQSANIEKKTMEDLLSKANFTEGEYNKIFKNNNIKLRPLVQFFRNLVQKKPNFGEKTNFVTKSRLHLWVPSTVVFGVEENPVMYYTDSDGYVVRVDNVSARTILKKLGAENVNDENDTIAVVKRPLVGEQVTNHASLLNVKQLKGVLEQQSQGVCVMQKFVRSKVPKASIARVAWSSTKPPYAYMISNKKSTTDMSEKEPAKRLLTCSENATSLNIFKTSGKAVDSLAVYVIGLLKYIQNTCKLRFKEFVVDFIKGAQENVKAVDSAPSGEASVTSRIDKAFFDKISKGVDSTEEKWWFVQVKAFVLDDIPIPKPLSLPQESTEDEDYSPNSARKLIKSDYIKLKECKMCLNLFHPSELGFAMSFKMICATENHLKRRAIKLPWFDRPEFHTITDTSMWYQEYKVCKTCYDMYIQEQKLAKVEVEFAKAIGIPVSDKVHQTASIINTSLSSKLKIQAVKKKNGLDAFNACVKSDLLMFRIITYINEMRNIPPFVKDKCYLQYSVLGSETVIPLKPEMAVNNILSVGKLRVFYLFARSVEDFRKWIRAENQVYIHFCVGDEVLGTATLFLNQFASGLVDKLDFMILFSNSKLNLCSVKSTFGFAQLRSMDLENIKLTPRGSVFIPPEDFFTADPLPDEWLDAIPRLSAQLPLDNIAKMDNMEKTRPLSARSIEKRPSSAKLTPPPASTPVSASKLLVRRTNASIKAAEMQKQAQLFPSSPKTAKPSNGRIRPQSAPSYKSQKLEQVQSPHLENDAGKFSPSTEHKEQSQVQPDVIPVETKIKLNADESVWHFKIRIGSVFDLFSTVDESWKLHYDLFGIITAEYESFQLFSNGPLVFDKEEEFFISATESAIMNYFGKERVFKIVLCPKYSDADERTAAIDLRNFQKSSTLEVMVPVENIKPEEVDATKFMETDSADDENVDEDEDKEKDIADRKTSDAKMQIVMSVRKLKMVHEYEALEVICSGEYNFKLLSSNSVNSEKNLQSQVATFDTLQD